MATWRDRVLKEFPSQAARLTLVADPDGLLTEEGILTGLKERGFVLIPFEDPVEFRNNTLRSGGGLWGYPSQYTLQVADRGQVFDLLTSRSSP